MNTRKNYELCVRQLIVDYPSPEERKPFALAFASFFQADNPRFDKTRFLAAAMEETSIRGGKR